MINDTLRLIFIQDLHCGLNFTLAGGINFIYTGNGNQPVPEPATMFLFGTGLASLF